MITTANGFARIRIFLAFLSLGAMTACRGTLEIGVERTAASDPSAAAVIATLAAENARLATRVAIQTLPNLGRLAYVQGGDIWIKALPDGKVQRLTADGRNREPRWAPSGEWLAYRKDRSVVIQRDTLCDMPLPRQETCREYLSVLQRQVWVADADGTRAFALNQELSVESFAWAPTQDQLAYVTESGMLQTIRPERAAALTLIAPETSDRSSSRMGRIAWNPQGNWIAYEWFMPRAGAGAYQGVWKISVDGLGRAEIFAATIAQKSDAILAGWTPQGRVLFWQAETRQANDGYWLYAISAEPPHALKKIGGAMLPYADFVAPAPGGTDAGARDLVAFVAGANQSNWLNKKIETTQPLTPPGIAAISPAWSADGKRMAYSGMTERDDLFVSESAVQGLMQRRLWIIDLPGASPPRRLTNASNYRDERPLWSADGNFLLFARMDTRGRASLWIVSSDGSVLRQVVEELTPAPDPFGSYGHVEWDGLFDWRRAEVR